jgi:hypothetical protein
MIEKREKSYKWIVNVGIFILSLIFCLVAVEILLREFKPFYFAQPIEAYEYDNDLAYRLRPGMNSFFLTDYQQEFRTNQLGTLNFQDNFSDYDTIIFTLGDSYTQGLGVPNDCSYPFQLDLLLNIDSKGFYSKKYGVVNLGLGPYGGKQYLITLKRYAKLLKKPNIVLYLGCWNDYSDDLLFESGVRNKNLVKNNPYYGWRYYPLKWLFMDTQIGARIKYIFQETILKSKYSKIEQEENKERSIAELEKNEIEKIVETTKKFGAVPILSWASVGDSYDWLRSWAAQNDIAFADWGPGALSVSKAIPGLPWDNSNSADHHRSWLNYMIAQEFAREIKKLQSLQNSNTD